MNKTSWIIIVFVLISLGIVAFLFNNFFFINGWKIVSKTTYESIILSDELSDSTKSGDIDKQIEIASQLLSRKSDNQAKIDLANAYLEKASLDFKEDEYSNKALVLINEVLAADSENFEAYLSAGYAYEVLQNYPKAFENYNKAIELNSNSDIAYVKRGHAYDLYGDLISAENDYTKAFQINSNNDTALMNLARIAQRKGDLENAKNYAKNIVETSDIAYVKATAHEIIGLAYLDSGDNQSAIENFSKSINEYKDYANAYSNRAYAKILLHNYEVKDNSLKIEIEQDINTALSIHEFSSFANVVNGLLMEAVGDNQKALSAYQKALNLVDKDITLGAAEKIDMKDKINQLINYLNNK
jgi:tetratricopeptide (TPR) repeat protein